MPEFDGKLQDNEVLQRLVRSVIASMKSGTATCILCRRTLPKSTGVCGAYFPNRDVVTVKGPAYRISAYAMCDDCIDAKGIEEATRKATQELVAGGVFLDRTMSSEPRALGFPEGA